MNGKWTLDWKTIDRKGWSKIIWTIYRNNLPKGCSLDQKYLPPACLVPEVLGYEITGSSGLGWVRLGYNMFLGQFDQVNSNSIFDQVSTCKGLQ